MIENAPENFPAQPFTAAFYPSFSHHNQLRHHFRQSARQQIDRAIESFDSGGNQYV